MRRVVLALRRAVLRAAPEAAEAIKFRCLCYYREEAWFGSIGGNVCMIEVRSGKRGGVWLSFIHGASLPDPDGLLQGKAKAKRFVPIASVEAAGDRRVAALLRAAAELRPWE